MTSRTENRGTRTAERETDGEPPRNVRARTGAQHQGNRGRPARSPRPWPGARRLPAARPLASSQSSTFSTDDDGSRPTTMPIASTIPNRDRLLSEKAQRGHDGEGADEGHRDGDQRIRVARHFCRNTQHHDGDSDDGVPPACDRTSALDTFFFFCFADEGGACCKDPVNRPHREKCFQLPHLGINAFRGIQGRSSREGEDGQGGQTAVVQGADCVLLRACSTRGIFGLGVHGHHVSQADDGSGRRRGDDGLVRPLSRSCCPAAWGRHSVCPARANAGLARGRSGSCRPKPDDDVGKLPGRWEPAQGVDGQHGMLGLRRRRLPIWPAATCRLCWLIREKG